MVLSVSLALYIQNIEIGTRDKCGSIGDVIYAKQKGFIRQGI